MLLHTYGFHREQGMSSQYSAVILVIKRLLFCVAQGWYVAFNYFIPYIIRFLLRQPELHLVPVISMCGMHGQNKHPPTTTLVTDCMAYTVICSAQQWRGTKANRSLRHEHKGTPTQSPPSCVTDRYNGEMCWRATARRMPALPIPLLPDSEEKKQDNREKQRGRREKEQFC